MSTMNDHRVERPHRFTPVRVRYLLISIHILIIVGFFLLSFLHGSFLWVATVVSFLPVFVYIPAAIWVSAKRSPRVFDRAGAEVAYLSIQMGLWLSIIILGLVYRGPTFCAEWSYNLGRYDQMADQMASEGVQISTPATVIDSCAIDTLLNAFSCIHFVLMGVWMLWIIWLVRRLPYDRKEAFRCGVSRILRGEYAVQTVDKAGAVELGTLSSTMSSDASDRTTSDPSIPPALPPRPQPLRLVSSTDIPPPAYEPPPAPLAGSSRPDVPDGVVPHTMDFDDFMRAQRQKEHKLLLERQGPASASPSEDEIRFAMASGSGTMGGLGSSGATSLPQRRRRGSA